MIIDKYRGNNNLLVFIPFNNLKLISLKFFNAHKNLLEIIYNQFAFFNESMMKYILEWFTTKNFIEIRV